MSDAPSADLVRALDAAAQTLATRLQQADRHIVFAESCTSGLVAATLSTVPGISQRLCGSAVTYRGATKTAWLGVEEADVERDGAVNDAVAKQMAEQVLERTPESSLALSITGHLGPDAPTHLDGVVFIGLTRRTLVPPIPEPLLTHVTRHELQRVNRRERQIEAAILVLTTAAEALDD